MNKPTIEQCRLLLSYDAESGVMVWRVNRGKARVGAQVGTRDKDGYRQVVLNGASIKVHRLAWFLHHGRWPDGEIDHINGVRDDNRILNLRVVTRSQNNQNMRRPPSSSKSGVLGAKLDKWGKFCSTIRKDGRQVWLGRFDTAEEAHSVYMAAKRVMHEACSF